MVMIGLLFGVVLAAVLLGFFLARSIVSGVKTVQATLTSMADNCATYLENGLAAFARNDLTVEVHAATHPIEKFGTDEIGTTGQGHEQDAGPAPGHDRELRDGASRSGRHGQRGEDCRRLRGSDLERGQRRRNPVGQRLHADRPDDQPGRARARPSRPRRVPTRAMPSAN